MQLYRAIQINNSTEHAILQFTQNVDNGKFTLGVFIDLSKAFDTVDHQMLLIFFKCKTEKESFKKHWILLKKLNHYGVNEKAMTWLQSYIFHSKQCLENTNDIKYLLEIDFGVTRRSILGPLLFLIYVNDFCLASKLKNVMFADDTNLLISDENIGELF